MQDYLEAKGCQVQVARNGREAIERVQAGQATLTETYHFLRLLYSKLGTQHCPGCGRPLTAQTQAAIVEQVRNRYGRRPARVLALKVLGRKGFHKEVLERAVKKGVTEARIDGTLTRLRSKGRSRRLCFSSKLHSRIRLMT